MRERNAPLATMRNNRGRGLFDRTIRETCTRCRADPYEAAACFAQRSQLTQPELPSA